MFDILFDELTTAPTPDLIDQIRAEEREISRRRARQLELIRELSRRSIRELSPTHLAGDLDISSRTATELLETARRTPELSDRSTGLPRGRRPSIALRRWPGSSRQVEARRLCCRRRTAIPPASTSSGR